MSEVDNLIRTNDQVIRESIVLGVEAENFLKSELGQFIANAAEVKVLAATDQLKTIDPNDSKSIIRLQTVIARYEHYKYYLRELVAAGDAAHNLYLQDFEGD